MRVLCEEQGAKIQEKCTKCNGGEKWNKKTPLRKIRRGGR